MTVALASFAALWLLACAGCKSEQAASTSTSTISTTSTSSGTGGGGGAKPSIVWKAIPAGSFQMGCSPTDSACMPDEKPSHKVELTAFEIAETEITQAQFRELIGSNPSVHSGCDDCPVEGLSWGTAVQLCKTAGGRLPSEAEWEYAARGSALTAYACGDAACLDGIAWYKTNAAGATHPVRHKAPNAFGLYDTIGNVLEYVSDFYGDTYYASSATKDPQGPTSGTAHVLRGSNFDFSTEFARVSLRNHDAESILKPVQIGVRCAR